MNCIVTAKSSDISAAALAHLDLLFLGWALRTAFAAGAALITGTTLTAGAATTLAAWAPRGPHLLQLLYLLGRQNLLQLRLYLSLQRRHLLLLVGGQVQLLLCPRGQQVKSARPAPGAALRPAFRRRTFTGRRRPPLFLRG
jgi:hypothetical protein